jgi:hypothetical protein
MLSIVNRVTFKRASELKRLINFNSFAFGRIVSLKLPDLGEGTKEATIKQWYKKEGDKVEEVVNLFYFTGRENSRSVHG